jgi:hypothetical protein
MDNIFSQVFFLYYFNLLEDGFIKQIITRIMKLESLYDN